MPFPDTGGYQVTNLMPDTGYLFLNCLSVESHRSQALLATSNVLGYPPELDSKTYCWRYHILEPKNMGWGVLSGTELEASALLVSFPTIRKLFKLLRE